MIVINCLPYQLIQTKVKIVKPAYDPRETQLQALPCITPTLSAADAVCMLCFRDNGRPTTFHRAGVAKIHISVCLGLFSFFCKLFPNSSNLTIKGMAATAAVHWRVL